MSASVRQRRFMRISLPVLVLGVLVAAGVRVSAVESAFTPTAVGEVEIKKIPAATVLEARSQDARVAQDDAFPKLFAYIRANKVAMTVPVETEPDAKCMRFFVGPEDAKKTLASTTEVAVKNLPERTVVSVGQRGSYTAEQYAAGVARLEQWLKDNPGWVRDGPTRAVYWNSPFMPGFMKRAEVHIPVKAAEPSK